MKLTKRLRQNLKNAIIAIYFAVGIYAMWASTAQVEHENNEYIKVKASYIYAGHDANNFIKLCWFGALIGIFIAVVLQIILKKSGSEDVLSEEWPEIVICPKCNIPLYGKDNLSLTCSNCQSPLEDIHNFYERHPTLKSIGKNASTPSNDI